ncbi:hypothetical protein AYO38_08345 [bacterium SCGC AG-212-C10]|nr:hypothetical protein AYO38_08345 [bacterium SCGC AG-212-C10]
MALFLVRRLSLMALTLLGVSMVVFAVVNIVPGDPIAGLLGPRATDQERDEFRSQYGFDKPLPQQYVTWLGNFVQGDMGNSVGKREPAADLLVPALKNTLILASAAFVFSIVVGFTTGLVAGMNRGRWLDKVCSTVAIAFMSLPPYWVGLMLIILFAVQLPWFPTSGMENARHPGGFTDILQHLVLPMIAASLASIGIIARIVRSSVIDIMAQDFVMSLRAKGLGGGRMLLHIVRNAAPPLLTVAGLQVGYLVGGSVLVETIFAWPGVGKLVFEAIGQRDLVMIQGGVLLVSVVFVFMNLLVDLVAPLVDPRMKHAS